MKTSFIPINWCNTSWRMSTRGSKAGIWVGLPKGKGQFLGDVQTDMLSIFQRATHLGGIVRSRELLLLASIGNIASDIEL